MDDAKAPHDIELYLLRHAHAGNPEDWTGNDAGRPLSAKGERQAEHLGRFLTERSFKPDVVITSPKLRASQTAELVAGAIGVEVSQDDRLGDRLDIDVLAAILVDHEGERVVLVGHDPDFSDLAATLTSAPYLPLKKGALCRLDVSLPLQPGSGILRWLVPPDLIG